MPCDLGAVLLSGFLVWMMEAAAGSALNKSGSGGSERSEDRGTFEYFGWVYHLGVNSIGHEYCHLRFLFIRGKYVAMYKRDPHEYRGIVCLLFPSFLCFFFSCFASLWELHECSNLVVVSFCLI